MRSRNVRLGAVLSDQDHVLEPGQRGPQRGHLALVEDLRRQERSCVPDLEARADGLRAEGREERAEHASILERPERGDIELRNTPCKDAHEVTLAEPETAQRAREPARLAVEIRVGEVTYFPALSEPAQGEVVRARTGGVAADGLVGDVQAPARRQAVQLGTGVLPETDRWRGLICGQIRRERRACRPRLDDRRERRDHPAARAVTHSAIFRSGVAGGIGGCSSFLSENYGGILFQAPPVRRSSEDAGTCESYCRP